MKDYEFSSHNEFLGKKQIINNKSIELLFGSEENSQKVFKLIHKNFKDENFIDVKDLSISDFVAKFVKYNKLSINDIKKDRSHLERFIVQAKKETGLTLSELANYLGINISKVGYYYRKNKDKLNY